MNKLKLSMFLGFMIIICPSVAFSEVLWSCNAMAAQPAGIPVLIDKHESSHGNVRFKDGKSGTISLICPVTYWPGPGYIRTLVLTYRDGDGHEGPSEVSAALRRVKRSSSTTDIRTLPNGRVSSNDSNAPNSGPKGWETHQSAKVGNVISHVPDFINYYYYVQITLKRNDDNVPLGVMGVYMTN